MHFRLLILPLFLLASSLFGQVKSDSINYSLLKVNGLDFSLKKDLILKEFGKPNRTFEPKYECGFFSEAEQGRKYFSLDYGNLKFTGNKKQGYQIEEIQFSSRQQNRITFRKNLLYHLTTIKEFEVIFGIKVSGNETLLYSKGADDGLIFKFSNGRLTKMEYWSPC